MTSPNSDIRIIRTRDLTAAGHGSRATLWRKRKKKIFPPPDINDGQDGWFPSTIENYLNRLAKEKQASR